MLHPLSADRQQPDEISDNDLPPDRPEKLSRSASFREESGDEEEELRWAQLLLLRRRIPVPARDGLRDSLTTASTSIRASTSRRCRCRRLTRRLCCRRSRCRRLVEGLGLVLADWPLGDVISIAEWEKRTQNISSKVVVEGESSRLPSPEVNIETYEKIEEPVDELVEMVIVVSFKVDHSSAFVIGVPGEVLASSFFLI
ncbi:hypothetical protein RHGRI_031403 [Rhododendron griersonianum]|uniref:Uncharacterized protein n=1 Tax=Rhododendron griersonianum TaxID=479676 RepID=A0AAV6IDL7_9ERIC|nr:hypothetical protein RHGRI_031403 [Rhododendron griersonianum]